MLAVVAFPHLAVLLMALGLAVPVAALLPAPVAAQQEPEFFDQPYAPGEWNIGRRMDEAQLRYCVDHRDPDWEVAAAIADAVAQGLLLEPRRYVVESDFVLEDITKIYQIMLEHCDMHMGFKLIPEGYSDWITVTRAYYEAEYAFVTADPDIHALADLAPSRPIGATMGTSAHIRLVSYLTALPVAKRWPTYPYGSSDLALQSLLNGTVDVAVVWAPSLWAKQREDPAYANLHVIDSNPLPPTTMGVGALMLGDETFLRNAVGEAITALIEDGTIQSILEEYEFPATVKP
ncbi:MAG: transporter substrate-binding domain-containing protein [Devosia sp.]|nr:transporter substrate-binding domain-containing protein [Devosia sp.]